MPSVPVKHAKPMRKMHDPAGAGSLPGTVEGTLSLSLSAESPMPLQSATSSAIAGLLRKGVESVDQFGDYGTKPRGKASTRGPLWGTSTHSTGTPASVVPDLLPANPSRGPVGTGPGERPRFRTNRGRGRGSVPDPGQIGDEGPRAVPRGRPRANRGRPRANRGRPRGTGTGMSAHWATAWPCFSEGLVRSLCTEPATGSCGQTFPVRSSVLRNEVRSGLLVLGRSLGP
jgi:hypothetical protein